MEAFEQRQVAMNESFDVAARTWSSWPPSASYSAKQSRSRRSYLWRPTKTSATSIKTRQEKSSWRPHEDWPPPMLSECQCLPYSSGHFLFQSAERTMHKRARLRTSENQKKKKIPSSANWLNKRCKWCSSRTNHFLSTAQIEFAVVSFQWNAQFVNCVYQHLRTCRYAQGKRRLSSRLSSV